MRRIQFILCLGMVAWVLHGCGGSAVLQEAASPDAQPVGGSKVVETDATKGIGFSDVVPASLQNAFTTLDVAPSEPFSLSLNNIEFTTEDSMRLVNLTALKFVPHKANAEMISETHSRHTGFSGTFQLIDPQACGVLSIGDDDFVACPGSLKILIKDGVAMVGETVVVAKGTTGENFIHDVQALVQKIVEKINAQIQQASEEAGGRQPTGRAVQRIVENSVKQVIAEELLGDRKDNALLARLVTGLIPQFIQVRVRKIPQVQASDPFRIEVVLTKAGTFEAVLGRLQSLEIETPGGFALSSGGTCSLADVESCTVILEQVGASSVQGASVKINVTSEALESDVASELFDIPTREQEEAVNAAQQAADPAAPASSPSPTPAGDTSSSAQEQQSSSTSAGLCADGSPQRVLFGLSTPISASLGTTSGYPAADIALDGSTLVVALTAFSAVKFFQLTSDSSSSSTLIAGQQNVVISNLTLVGSYIGVPVKRVTVFFDSSAQDTAEDLTNFKLFQGTTQLSSASAQTTSSSETYLRFNIANDLLVVPAYGSVNLTVHADVIGSASSHNTLTTNSGGTQLSDLITVSTYDPNSLTAQNNNLMIDYQDATGERPNHYADAVSLQGIFPITGAGGQSTGTLVVTRTSNAPVGGYSTDVVMEFQLKAVNPDLTVQSLKVMTAAELTGNAAGSLADLRITDIFYNAVGESTVASDNSTAGKSYVIKSDLSNTASSGGATWDIEGAYTPVILDAGLNRMGVSPAYSSGSTPPANMIVYTLGDGNTKVEEYRVYADLSEVPSTGYDSIGFSAEDATMDSNGTQVIFGDLHRYNSSTATSSDIPAAIVVPAGSHGNVTRKPTFLSDSATTGSMLSLAPSLTAIYSLFRVPTTATSSSLNLMHYPTTRGCL